MISTLLGRRSGQKQRSQPVTHGQSLWVDHCWENGSSQSEFPPSLDSVHCMYIEEAAHQWDVYWRYSHQSVTGVRALGKGGEVVLTRVPVPNWASTYPPVTRDPPSELLLGQGKGEASAAWLERERDCGPSKRGQSMLGERAQQLGLEPGETEP